MRDQSSRGARREVRFFVAGQLVSPEDFWEAVRALGGRATIEALDSEPLYQPTVKGEAALARGRGQAGRP